MKNNKNILLVEDSDEDFSAFMRVKQEFNFPYPVYRACDGDEALDYLYHIGNDNDATALTFPRPSIIIMDLNLPGTDGREVIEQLKQDNKLKNIPVIVLTTSDNIKDIQTCYNYGVNSYLLKPMSLADLKKTVQTLFKYWFEIVALADVSK